MLDHTQALGGAIKDLRSVLVRTVRTSTEEVQRRMFERRVTDLPCSIEVAGRATSAATISDLSEGGARITGAHGLALGTHGSLKMAGVASPVAFTVVGLEAGIARIGFDADQSSAQSLRVLLERLIANQTAGGLPRAA